MNPATLRSLFWSAYTVTVGAAGIWFWHAPSLGRVLEAFVTLLLTTAAIALTCHVLDVAAARTRKRHPEPHSEWRTPNP